MHYVKEFDINNVATRQVACIELHGKPNAATEGYVGVLGIDVDSTLHEVYKCVAVNGSIYSWELLSNGLSIISSSIFGGGAARVDIPYDKLRVPTQYVIKVGDTILDIEGYVYQIDALGANSCSATYSNTRLVTHGLSAYELAVEQGFEGNLEEWFESMRGYSVHIRYSAYPDGRDYTAEWRRGLNYIGIAIGKDAPMNANGYQWSVFAPGIYVGSGVMPDYADIQIDPDGTPLILPGAEDINNLMSNIDRNSKRITNLEKGLVPSPFETDNSVAYAKNVPLNTLPYAEVTKIGGMTYRDESEQTLKSALVTEVESVGANLFDDEKIIKTNNIIYSDGIFKQIAGDTRPLGYWVINAWNNDNFIKTLGSQEVNQIGVYKSAFSKDGTFNRLTIGEGGATIDTNFVLDVSDFGDGTYYISAYFTNITQGSVTFQDVMVSTSDIAYKPFTKHTLPIPAEVQNIEGYGWGVSDTCYNYIDLEKKQFVKRVERVVLDGSADEKWNATAGLNATDYNAFYVRLYAENSHKTAWGEAVGDTLPNRTVADIYNKNCDGFWTGDKTDKQIIVRVPNTITNATELRTWLSANPLTVYYEAMETTVIDVSDILSNDNYIEVEGGGTLTFKNENKTDVPSEVTYQTKEVSA